jgi:hypothetical protein
MMCDSLSCNRSEVMHFCSLRARNRKELLQQLYPQGLLVSNTKIMKENTYDINRFNVDP